MYHGISAFNHINTTTNSTDTNSTDTILRECLERINTLQKEHICSCWSDIPLGPIGVFSDPDNVIMSSGFPKDCWSLVDSDGFRDAGNSYTGPEYNRKENESNFDFFCRVRRNRKQKSHCEFFVYDAQPDAIWASKEWADVAHKIGKKLNLPVMIDGQISIN